MERPTRDESCMEIACVIAKRSTCSRAAVGVVIVRDGRILSTGYNGAPAGLPHCDHRCNCGQPNWIPGGTDPGVGHTKWCQVLQPCTNAIHAEANAIGYAARWSVGVVGATLFTTFCPCLPCAQLIVTAGITRVVYQNEYRDRSGLLLLESAKIDMMLMS